MNQKVKLTEQEKVSVLKDVFHVLAELQKKAPGEFYNSLQSVISAVATVNNSIACDIEESKNLTPNEPLLNGEDSVRQ